jgi:AraC family transcriptional regulator
MKLSSFSYLETHHVVHQPGNLVHRSSEDAGWSSLFASVCSEAPYEGSFPAVNDHLVVIPLKQPVGFTRRICGEIQERILPPGSTTITPGGADFSIRTSSKVRRYDTMHFYIRDRIVRDVHAEMFGSIADFTLRPCVGVMDRMFQAIAIEIHRMLESPWPADKVYAETLSRTVASCLVRNYVSGRPLPTSPSGKLTPEQRTRAIEYIEECLGDGLTLTAIAKAAGVGTGRLIREFKKTMNIAPYEYVVRARVERATYLLTATDLSLAEVAVQCGFSNQQHMTRMVHRIAGRTPGAIRRER